MTITPTTAPGAPTRSPINFDRFVRGLIALLIIIGVGTAIYFLSGVLLPFFIAWMVAYLLYPVVIFFQKRCRLRSRLLSIIVTLLLTAGLLAGFFWLVVPPMTSELAHLKDVALAYVQKGAGGNVLPQPVQSFIHQHVSANRLAHLLEQGDVVQTLKDALPKVWTVLWSTAGVIVNLAASCIALLYLLFILTDYERYANSWKKFVPARRRPFVARLVADIEHGMAGYFRGQALVALSNCLMFSIGFWLIDFPVPVGLGCLIGVISFVPYLQVVGFVPAALLALLKAVETGANFWWLLFLVLVVYLVVQILQDTIFTPRIMGRIMGLPPAIILLSLSVWGYALGIIGLIIALPVTTLMISYYRRYVVGDEPDEALDTDDEALSDPAGQFPEPAEEPAPDPAKTKKVEE